MLVSCVEVILTDNDTNTSEDSLHLVVSLDEVTGPPTEGPLTTDDNPGVFVPCTEVNEVTLRPLTDNDTHSEVTGPSAGKNSSDTLSLYISFSSKQYKQ